MAPYTYEDEQRFLAEEYAEKMKALQPVGRSHNPGGPTFYSSPEAAVLAASKNMRDRTAGDWLERGAGVYELFGQYFVGSIYTGEELSITNGFIASLGAFVKQVGFMHSHPYGESFTAGDGFIAKVTGTCYVVTPNNIYKMYGDDLEWDQVWPSVNGHVGLDDAYRRPLFDYWN